MYDRYGYGVNRWTDSWWCPPVILFGGITALLTAYFIAVAFATDSYKAYVVRSEAQDAADAKPRMIREFDGCKVYAFKGGDRWHYVTRCPRETDTESNWTEQRGKVRVPKSENIITENK